MEKFYIVTTESDLYDGYMKYKENIPVVNEVAKFIMQKYGVETLTYAATNDYLYIEATKDDVIKFGKQLKNPTDNNLYAFKKSSEIGKEWVLTLKEKDITVLRKPMVGMYFSTIGKSRSRLFDIDGTVYATYDNDGEFKNPIGFQEIKGSEFYKIIEDVKNK